MKKDEKEDDKRGLSRSPSDMGQLRGTSMLSRSLASCKLASGSVRDRFRILPNHPASSYPSDVT